MCTLVHNYFIMCTAAKLYALLPTNGVVVWYGTLCHVHLSCWKAALLATHWTPTYFHTRLPRILANRQYQGSLCHGWQVAGAYIRTRVTHTDV